MPLLATLAGKIIAGALIVLLATGGVAGWAYATDQAVEADVVDKQCAGPFSIITAKTRLMGITRDVEVSNDQCTLVPRDAYVLYHLRSGRTIIYEAEGGRCIWDTAFGPCGVPLSSPLLTYQ